jgi:hydroxylamine dehydrogenase
MGMRAAVLLLLAAAPACDSGNGAPPLAAQAESCEGCHARINPGLVKDHRASPHARIPLACEDCHGTDHTRILAAKGAVSPGVCAACHPKAFEEFRRSRHGQRLKEGKLDRILDPALQATGGCTSMAGCHSIQRVYADGTVGRCGACHATHAFRSDTARDPQVCAGCHGGIDNPQLDAWQRSAHSLPSPAGKGRVADCVACHGTHDVSDAIVHGLPPLTEGAPVAAVPEAPPGEFERARATMLARCTPCHTGHFARAALAKADLWRYRGATMLDAAARIVRALDAEGRLSPSPHDRIANPVAGHALRLGSAQIFDEAVSLPERIYYEMHFQLYPALWRAAYHNDPERLLWHSNDAMKSAFDRLEAAAHDLRSEKEAGTSGGKD